MFCTSGCAEIKSKNKPKIRVDLDAAMEIKNKSFFQQYNKGKKPTGKDEVEL